MRPERPASRCPGYIAHESGRGPVAAATSVFTIVSAIALIGAGAYLLYRIWCGYAIRGRTLARSWLECSPPWWDGVSAPHGLSGDEARRCDTAADAVGT